MSEQPARSDYLPLTRFELMDLLCADSMMTEADRACFRSLCERITAIHHLHYNGQLQEIKRAYAPFDPDSECRKLLHHGEKERQQRLNVLYREFAELLELAHFQHLSRREIEPVLHSASDWGLRMNVDFNVFEYLAIFARGEALQKRVRSRWLTLYRPEEVDVPIWRRLVLILKLRRHKRLKGPVDTSHVYLKIFKDIPKLDVMMLLPGARIQLTGWDRSKIGLPFLSGLAAAGWNLIQDVTHTLQSFLLAPNALWGIAAGGIGYGYKSYYGYVQTRRAYHLSLAQSLYFQNLDSNAGVLTRLLDEAEEQQCLLTILAYYCLYCYAGPEGWGLADLNLALDLFLDRYAELDHDCSDLDTLADLRKLGLVEPVGPERFRALPLERAVEVLDASRQRREPDSPRGTQSTQGDALGYRVAPLRG